jgi:hypothetical protein
MAGRAIQILTLKAPTARSIAALERAVVVWPAQRFQAGVEPGPPMEGRFAPPGSKGFRAAVGAHAPVQLGTARQAVLDEFERPEYQKRPLGLNIVPAGRARNELALRKSNGRADETRMSHVCAFDIVFC